MIPVKRAHLCVSAVTHPGLNRKNNEDRYAVSAHHLSKGDSTPSLLAVVADGVGGHRAGEVAAGMAVEIISQVVIESDGHQPTETLKEAIHKTSHVISTQADNDPALQGMSATCACAWVIGERLYTVYVGDSRIYLVREDEIRQLTIDHTWVQEAIEAGALTPDQARGHPSAHIIRRHLGSQQSVVPDIRMRLEPTESDAQSEANQGLRLLSGDQLLLCSDGLTDLVDDAAILEVLMTNTDQEAVDELLNLANARGGHDNITIVALRVPEGGLKSEKTLQQKRRSLLTRFLIVFATFLLGAILIASLYWNQVRSGLTTTTGSTPTVVFSPDQSGQEMISPTENLQSETTTASAPDASMPAGSTLISPDSGEGYTQPLVTYTPWPTSTQGPITETPTGDTAP